MTRNNCYRCDWYLAGDQGNICLMKGIGYFDVDAARRIIRTRRRPPETLMPDEIRQFHHFITDDPTEAHLDHVNPRKFGIVATYPLGRRRRRYRFVLEGNHRAHRAIRDGRPFRFYVLTDEESDACFLGTRPPDGMTFVTK
jgi:hypothetical protein